MNKLSFAAMLGSLLVFGGCSAATEGPGDDEGEPQSVEQAASANACHYKCNPCPANQICAMYCTLNGACKSCPVLMLCAAGYTFDDTSCKCRPDKQAGEPCGNGNCGAGEFCCNSSCGICAPIGGVCTMQVCSSPTL